MPYPAGVQTVTLRLGSSFDSAGALASITGHVVPLFGAGADHLVWSATGQTYAKVRTNLAWDDTEKVALAIVPHPTQAGWKDQTQATFAGWSYQISAVAVYDSGERHAFERTVTPLPGDTVIDVDLLPNGAAATPTVVAEWEVTRVAAVAALDATKIKRFDLTANLTVDPSGWPTDQVVTAIYTQPASGGPYSVTYAGQAVPIAPAGSTKVEWTHDGTSWKWHIPGAAATADEQAAAALSLRRSVQAMSAVKIPGAMVAATWLNISGGGTIAAANDQLTITTASGVASMVGLPTGALTDGGGVSLSLKHDGNLASISVRYVINPSNVRVYNAPLRPVSESNMMAGRWYRLTYPLSGALEITGTPPGINDDLSKVARIDLTFTPKAGEVAVVNIRSATIVKGEPRGGVCFQFDDGRIDNYTIAKPILDAAGYKGTIAVEHTTVGWAGTQPAGNNGPRLTLAQLREMYASGWSFLGHHNSNMTTMTESQQRAVHEASKAWLTSNGFTRGAKHWVWPGGIHNAATDTIAADYWATRRGISPLLRGCTVTGYPEPSDPTVQYVTQSLNINDIKFAMDRAKSVGGVLTLVFHSILPDLTYAGTEDITTATFQDIVDYAVSLGLRSYQYEEVHDPAPLDLVVPV